MIRHFNRKVVNEFVKNSLVVDLIEFKKIFRDKEFIKRNIF